MDLELLSSRKNRQLTSFIAAIGAFVICFTWSKTATADSIIASSNVPVKRVSKPKPKASVKHYQSYQDLQQHVLELMRSAKQRIWLTSHFLADDEVILGLYVARYRRVDIRVGVGKEKAFDKGSRYQALKNEKIKIKILPLAEKSKSRSSLVVDEKGFRISTDLDPNTQQEVFKVVEVKLGPKVRNLAQKRDKIPQQRFAKNPWRKRLNVLSSKKPTGSNGLVLTSKKHQVFDYSGIKTEKPTHVETKLPRTTKWSRKNTKNEE